MSASLIRQGVWWLTFLAALGSGLASGVFFAFSNFIMKALGDVSADRGIAVMQAINVTVINPLFMAILFGTAATCVPLLVYGFRSLHKPESLWLIAGCLLYLFGTIVVTAAFNVPLNNQLAGIHPGNQGSAETWARYLHNWTLWNHARTASSLLACASFVLAICRLKAG